jgi:hypothetical protein
MTARAPALWTVGGVSTRGDGERRVVEPRWRRGRLALRMVVDPYHRIAYACGDELDTRVRIA